MIKTSVILNKRNEEIIQQLSGQNIEYAIYKYKTLDNFCDIYQDGALLCGEDEFYSPNEYIDMIKNIDMNI